MSLNSKICRVLLSLLTVMLVRASLVAGSDTNLPQSQVEISIKGKDHQRLRHYFAGLNDAPAPVDSTIAAELIHMMPKSYRTSCTHMIDLWGKSVRGTGQTLIRALYLQQQPAGVVHVFLTFLCFSSSFAYSDKYYDERLILLTIDSSSSLLTVLPPANPCIDCSNLYHIELGDTTHIGGNPAISLIASSSSDNPCCGGGDVDSEETWIYYVFEGQSVRKVLSLLKYRTQFMHSDESGDSTVSLSADFSIEKDPSGNITRIVIGTTTKANEKPVGETYVKYSWNWKMRQFQRLGL